MKYTGYERLTQMAISNNEVAVGDQLIVDIFSEKTIANIDGSVMAIVSEINDQKITCTYQSFVDRCIKQVPIYIDQLPDVYPTNVPHHVTAYKFVNHQADVK